MTIKYNIDQIVRFTFEGQEYQGKIQGMKQGTGQGNGDQEPLHWVWIGDKGFWVRQSWIQT